MKHTHQRSESGRASASDEHPEFASSQNSALCCHSMLFLQIEIVLLLFFLLLFLLLLFFAVAILAVAILAIAILAVAILVISILALAILELALMRY